MPTIAAAIRKWAARVPAPRACALAAALALAVVLAGVPARAVEIDGIDVAEAVQVDGTPLQLNGAGTRTVYIVKAYVAALYVPRRSASPEALLAQRGARRLSLTMLADLSADWIAERFVKALQANHRGPEFERLRPRLERLIDTMLTLGQTHKGERIDIDVVGGATRVSVDGHALGPAVPGEDVFGAILRIFVGAHPLDEDLRRAMLGR
ncbi:MAG: chalcone isomerase family protein [Burkholderiales bacterium]|nr:chalcone isomerase family protein [Burkholderiales bacterium]